MGELNAFPNAASLSLCTNPPDSIHQPATNPAGAGFMVLSSSLSPVAYNPQAAQILAYPETTRDPLEINELLALKVRTKLVVKHTPSGSAVFATEFKSGRRPYVCRSFDLGSHTRGSQGCGVGLLFERKLVNLIALDRIAQRFKLTQRERESVEYLLKGQTSKEIAAQMGISANTVKCFLRFVMIKMGATTRSGIIGKIVACEND